MKKVWRFLKNHIREDFDLRLYAVVAVFLALSLSVNYTFDFEDNYLEPMSGYLKFFAYFIFYSIPYFFSVSVYSVFKNRKNVFHNHVFWIKSLFAITILSLDSSTPYLQDLIDNLFRPQVRYWAYKVSINSISFLTIFLPILIFYFLYEKKEKHLYGLSAHQFDASPYFIMLLIMLPLIIIASFNESFLHQYPMYRTSAAHVYLHVPEWFTVGGYELAYGFDFITVEYFFRGFLVIGMMTLLGRGAVLSMAVVYCFLHFGKPAGEAVSSIAGGYLLGVVAYETKSVWGGIIVHMGIAWTMEIVAFLHKI